jgi:hypothetical protein
MKIRNPNLEIRNKRKTEVLGYGMRDAGCWIGVSGVGFQVWKFGFRVLFVSEMRIFIHGQKSP